MRTSVSLVREPDVEAMSMGSSGEMRIQAWAASIRQMHSLTRLSGRATIPCITDDPTEESLGVADFCEIHNIASATRFSDGDEPVSS